MSMASLTYGQDMTSKKGTPILPEVGDYWIGIDAVPILEYVGNMWNSGSNSAPSWSYTDSLVITGGKVIDANTSYRARLRLGIIDSRVNEYATVDDANAGSQAFDKVKMSQTNIEIGLGIQKNRGNHRIRGIYGAQARIGFGSGKTTHEFANAFSDTNQQPSTGIPGQGGSSRVTEVKNGSTFLIGVGGFVGAEYFFAPKISIAGEFGLGISYSSTGEGEVTNESWDSTASAVTTDTAKTGKSNAFVFDSLPSGSLVISFYF